MHVFTLVVLFKIYFFIFQTLEIPSVEDTRFIKPVVPPALRNVLIQDLLSAPCSVWKVAFVKITMFSKATDVSIGVNARKTNFDTPQGVSRISDARSRLLVTEVVQDSIYCGNYKEISLLNL